MLIKVTHLSKAVALTQLSLNSMKVIGPSLSGLLVAVIGFKSTLLIEVLLFLFALFFALTLKMPSRYTDIVILLKQEIKEDKFIDELKVRYNYILKNKT